MNTKLKMISWVLPALLLAAALGLMIGCEGSSTEDDASGVDKYFETESYASDPRYPLAAQEMDIKPPNVQISFIKQEVAFTVSGGNGIYHWHVGNSAKGAINAQGDNQALYVVTQLAENSVTVEDTAGHYAVAYLTPSTSTGAVPLVVSPPSVTLATGQLQASFAAQGGHAPYVWVSGNIKLGSVTYAAQTSHIAAYTAVAGVYGQNVVTVTDADGRRASATIITQQQ